MCTAAKVNGLGHRHSTWSSPLVLAASSAEELLTVGLVLRNSKKRG
jgi:hypothetical protein